MSKFTETYERIKASLDNYKRLPNMYDNSFTIGAEYYTILQLYWGHKVDEVLETLLYLNHFYWERSWAGMILRSPKAEGGMDRLQQHDDMVSLSSRNGKLARALFMYGLKHFGSFDQRPNKPYSFPKMLINWTMLKEYLATLRQPYQWAMIELGGFGVAGPVGYLHLILTIIWTAIFTPKGNTSGKMLLWIFSNNAYGFGSPLAWFYKILMRMRWGKSWDIDIWSIYYANYPDFLDLFKALKDEKNNG